MCKVNATGCNERHPWRLRALAARRRPFSSVRKTLFRRGFTARATHVPHAFSCAFALAFLLALSGAGAASAAGKADDPLPLSASGAAEVRLARVDIAPVPLETAPSSITTGIPCGMTDMCGQDPCLCGAVDEYGACACNGRKETLPAFALAEGSEGPVRLVALFDKAYLVPVASGEADVRVVASFPHYEPAETTLHVIVEPLAPLDIAKIAGMLVVFAALVLGVFLAARTFCRSVRRRLQYRRLQRRGRRPESSEQA